MEQYALELYHHGVKGMKWGVRKQRKAERDAKKLSKLGAKHYEALDRYRGRVNVATALGAHGDRRVQKVIRQTEKQVSRASDSASKFLSKLKKRYANTPVSDIATATNVSNGRAYCQVLMGYVGDSPYDGTPLYRVTAGTHAKTT